MPTNLSRADSFNDLPFGSGNWNDATFETSADVCSSRQPEIIWISAGIAFFAFSKGVDIVQKSNTMDTEVLWTGQYVEIFETKG